MKQGRLTEQCALGTVIIPCPVGQLSLSDLSYICIPGQLSNIPYHTFWYDNSWYIYCSLTATGHGGEEQGAATQYHPGLVIPHI